MVNIAVDVMGGDNAPVEIVNGCVEALSADAEIHLSLVGKTDVVEKELAKYSVDEKRITVVEAPEVIGFDEVPTVAVKAKKNSSLVVGLNLVKKGEVGAFVSAGSTGALLTGATLIVGRVNGARERVERAFLATLLPTEKQHVFLADCGANSDCKPLYLAQFAKIGALYMENVCNIANPTVGLVNIGAEREKGNVLTKETYVLLEESAKNGLNFVGNVEPKDIFAGKVDVAVCDGFVGNVILKLSEGLTHSLMSMIKNAVVSSTKAKVGGFLIKDALNELKRRFDPSAVGGAPFLGLNGLVVKAHGSSDGEAIKNAVLQCQTFIKSGMLEKIRANL